MKTNRIIQRAALFSMMLGMAAFNAVAAEYFWNPDSTNGSGVWTGSSWSTALAGGARDAYLTTTATVNFSATNVYASAIDLDGNQTARRLQINAGQTNLSFTNGNLTLTDFVIFSATVTIDNYLTTNELYLSSANSALILKNGGKLTSNIGGSGGATSKVVLQGGVFEVGKTGTTNTILNVGTRSNANAGLFIEQGATLSLTGTNVVSGISGGGNTGRIVVNGGLLAKSTNGYLTIGDGYSAELILNTGTVQILNAAITPGTGGLNVGRNTASSMEVNGGLLQTTALNLNGQQGNTSNTTSYTQTGGVAEIGTLTLGKAGGYVANRSTALVDLRGGTLKLGAGGIVNSGSAGTTYAYIVNLSGGTLGATADWSSSVDILLSNANGGVTFDTTGGNIELSGTVQGYGRFTKAGAGTLLLSGANTYNGDAIVSAGALQVDDTLTLGTLTLALNGADNGWLAGGGSVTLSALNIDTSLSAGGSGWQLIDLTGGLNLSAYTVSGYTETVVGSGVWNNGAFEFDQNTGYLSIIPEPSTWALLLTGAAALMVSARRRK